MYGLDLKLQAPHMSKSYIKAKSILNKDWVRSNDLGPIQIYVHFTWLAFFYLAIWVFRSFWIGKQWSDFKKLCLSTLPIFVQYKHVAIQVLCPVYIW